MVVEREICLGGIIYHLWETYHLFVFLFITLRNEGKTCTFPYRLGGTIFCNFISFKPLH